ncbi:Cilia- and flagella-associated protein 70 [Hondaea fermentalgiana]|uniref:Cilia-and flagella-associated protein 70 n=1 Tax=Hondaea fermentalgiana TaxID=2315210 RepID=A0A2R5G5B4_9STRA|nr:Cilia- and flagella-associated protein 70 [Hondaea fermentalgiana]|eukprot:GBG25539.1 Cilia- and flagella-associated protein 70 [Hondaea fermentalgiana]
MAKKAKLDKAKNDEANEADSRPDADAPPVERGDLKISFPSFRVSPENDEQGLWFRWRLAAIESEGEVAPNAIVSAGCTEVVECTSGDLGFDAAVRGVPLSADFVNSALTAARSGSNEAYEIVVEAYRGEYGNAEEDELVGKSSIGLIPLMSNVQEPLQVDLRLCESAESDADESKNSTMLNSLVLSIRIEALGKLYDYWTNGAVLACDKVTLRDLPEEWSARFREGETTGVALKLGDSALLCNGKLVLEASTSVEDVVDAAETAESPEASTEASSEPAVWQIQLTAEGEEEQGLGQQQYVFLSPLDIQELREAGRAMLSVVVDAPPAEDARLELVAAGLTSSAPLLQPGEARAIMTANLDIKNVPVLSEEETNDEGERKQVEEESVGAKCSLSVQMTLARALVPAPPVPKPRLASVRDLVEGRPARRMRRQSALEMLDEAAAEIVDRVTSVYGETKSEEERERAHLLHNLNVNGHYQRMRLALKEALSKFVTSERLGEFAGLDGDVLYCAVFERALALLNQTFNDKVEAAKRGQTSLKAKPTPARRLTELQERLTNLLARAYDLESAGLLAEAEEVFQERVGDAEKTALMDGEQDLPVDPIVWFEYADFCLRNGEERRAVAAECLRSALAIDDGHVSSLVAYGAVLMDSGSDAQAETFLVRAVEAGLPTGASVRAKRDIVTAHGLSDMALWADLGKQFFENGDLERAAAAFRARADLGAPQIPEFARVLLLQNKFEEASTLVDALAANEDVDDVEIVSLRELMAKLVVQGTV